MSKDSRSRADISEAEKAHPTERRRFPRLAVSKEQFRLKDGGKIFGVADLSLTGMALRLIDREDHVLFTVGRRFEGILNLDGDKRQICAQVRRTAKDLVGCEFLEITRESAAAIAQHLDPVLLGRDLKHIPTADPKVSWFHGSSGTDLFLWGSIAAPLESLVRFAILVRGGYIQWARDDGLQTGNLLMPAQAVEESGLVRLETLSMQPDPTPDADKIRVAKALILSSNVPESQKMAVIKHL